MSLYVDAGDIVQALRSHIMADGGAGGVRAYVSDRIYSQEGPPNAPMPFVFIDEPEMEVESAFTADDSVSGTLNVDVFGQRLAEDGAATVRAIASRIYWLFERVELGCGGRTLKALNTRLPFMGVDEDAFRARVVLKLFVV